MQKKIFLFLLVYHSIQGQAQHSKKKAVELTPIKKHISILSADSMEGRGTGTLAEKRAGHYITSVMVDQGLSAYPKYPKHEQPFIYTAQRFATINCKFKTLSVSNEVWYKKDKDYWPLSMSSTGRAFSGWFQAGYGISAPELTQNDYQTFNSLDSGKIFFINIGNPDGINPHSPFAKYDLTYRVNEALKHGASGVVFYKNDPKVAEPDSTFSPKNIGVGIPVIYTNNSNISNNKLSKTAAVYIETEIISIEKEGNNILGTLDFGKLYTMVIGAHYDHLGWGEQGGSLHNAQVKAIHNGADDNASGVGVMLELIKIIKNDHNLQEYNYMFVAFSGEELGLYGSSSLVKNMPVNLARINCMINMDMVGRLDTAKKILVVGGVGTSRQWMMLDSIETNGLQIKKTESGVGPSDHTSFYKENIPVLHFFTGTHSDYHKPTDDEIYINYDGIELVKKYIVNILKEVNKRDKLSFTKTKDSEGGERTKYKVTLGIMPDYTYDKMGIMADAVTIGKPASNAGILKGDVILKLGDFATADMKAYVQALSNFSKGDQTQVTILRNGKEIMVLVTF